MFERKREACKENTGKFQCDCKEVLTYGFYLRFVKQNYIPCNKCQGRLHAKIMKYKWSIQNNEFVKLVYQPALRDSPTIYFEFLFLSANHPTTVGWTPCDSCQPFLMDIIKKSEFILGNKEYTDPPVELWRKWMPKK